TLSAQGRADASRQRRDRAKPHQRRAVQRDRRPVSDPKNPIDQDALAAEWGLALEADAGNAPAGGGGAAADDGEGSGQWSAVVDDGTNFMQASKGGAERVLNQEEIDSLLGFSLADISLNDNSGIRAIIDSAMVSYERLPMLEIVFDRLVRLMTTSL